MLAVMVACGETWPSVHAELVHRYDPGTLADARRATFGRDRDRPARDRPGHDRHDHDRRHHEPRRHGPRDGRALDEAAAAGSGDAVAPSGPASWGPPVADWESIVDAWAADLADPASPGPGGATASPRVPAGLAPAAAVPAPAPPTRGEDATDPVVRRGRLLAAEGRLRVEWPDEDEVTVVAGELWRRRRGEVVSGTGVVGAAGSALRPGVVVREQLLVRPWQLLSWLRPRLVASVQAGGRPSTRLAMVPRPGPRPPALEGLADGAQRFDVVVDDETGVVVELAAYYLGRLAERCALRHLTVGDTPDNRLFDLTALG